MLGILYLRCLAAMRVEVPYGNPKAVVGGGADAHLKVVRLFERRASPAKAGLRLLGTGAMAPRPFGFYCNSSFYWAYAMLQFLQTRSMFRARLLGGACAFYWN